MPAAVPLAIVGGSIIGGAMNKSAASSAANAQTHAADTASQTQLSMYNQTRADQAPWRQAGGQAVGALSQFYGMGGGSGGVDAQGNPTQGGSPDYSQILSGLPGYQFQQQQGEKAVQQNLAARGLLQSGAAGKALTQYGQGLGDQYAGQYTSGLQSLAGLGQSSAQATGQAGANAANQVGSNQIYAGNAQASGYANQANAVNAGLSGIVQGLGYGQSTGWGASGYGGGNASQSQNFSQFTPSNTNDYFSMFNPN